MLGIGFPINTILCWALFLITLLSCESFESLNFVKHESFSSFKILKNLLTKWPIKIVVISIYEFRSVLTMVLLNGPPLSNFVDRGVGEWEWLGPGSTKMALFLLHSQSLCVTRPKTYLLWFWLPPSFPILTHGGLHSGLRPRAPTSNQRRPHVYVHKWKKWKILLITCSKEVQLHWCVHYVKNFSSFWNANLGQLSSNTLEVTWKSWPFVIVPSIIMEGISFSSYLCK